MKPIEQNSADDALGNLVGPVDLDFGQPGKQLDQRDAGVVDADRSMSGHGGESLPGPLRPGQGPARRSSRLDNGNGMVIFHLTQGFGDRSIGPAITMR